MDDVTQNERMPVAFYSCGSLGRCGRQVTAIIPLPLIADYSCGCMDYGFRRPKEAWEASDGAVHMLKELARAAPETVPELLPKLAQIAELDGFEACRTLQATIWRQLPLIAQGLGKKVRNSSPMAELPSQQGGARIMLCMQEAPVRSERS